MKNRKIIALTAVTAAILMAFTAQSISPGAGRKARSV